MIALDTSSIVAYLTGENGADVEMVDNALSGEYALLPPVVLTELRSDPKLEPKVRTLIAGLPLMELHEGYWERVGKTRATLFQRKLKARLADALIAQSCIDHRMPLVTRDSDFRHFVRYCGLRLVTETWTLS